MNMRETDIKNNIKLLSEERLNAVIERADFEDSNIGALTIKIHQEAISLGGALMSIVAVIEIALRNIVCENLDQHFGSKTWLSKPPPPFKKRDKEIIKKALTDARRAKYAKLTRLEKDELELLAYPDGRPENTPHQDRVAEIRKKISVSHGDIIAQLTVYFWKRIYGSEYEHYLWKKTLKRTFPNKEIARSYITAQLEIIYQTRNRLAHHEPVLFERFDNAINAIQFIAKNLNQPAPNPDSPLSSLLACDIKKITKQAENLHTMMNRPTTP